MITNSHCCIPRILFFLWVGASALDARPRDDSQFGPTGIHGMRAKQELRVTYVAEGSPADGKVKAQDVIVGANGKKFEADAVRELAAAIGVSEGASANGKLTLELKGGRQAELKLKVLGDFSDTAPANCKKTDAIVTAVADRMITMPKELAEDHLAVGWLGLMATGEDKYLDFVKANLPAQEWAKPDREQIMAVVRGEGDLGYVGWYWGYRLIALCEYHLLTGDKSVLPGIETYAVALSKGQDAAGTWGHRMATQVRGGRLPGYAHINQPSLACFIGLALARKCGIDDPAVVNALAKCQGFFNTFTGRGAIPYGVHSPNSRDFDNNGMGGLAALAMSLVGDKEAARFFSRQVAADYDRLETGHATHFFNVIWSPLGANVAGPEVAREFHKRSDWLYTLYRSWDDQFTHNGRTQKAINTNGALLLNYCTPRKAIFITGKNADASLWARGAEVQDVMNLSQIDYKKLSVDELIAMFGHEAPQVRRRAQWALRERDGDFHGKLEKMIGEGSDLQQETAIGFYGYQCPPEWAEPRMPMIAEVLKNRNENPEVRAQAASALAWHAPHGKNHFEDILRLLLEDKADDAYGLIDETLGSALTTISTKPFADGMVEDKALFYSTVRKLSRNPRQGARGNAMRLLSDMPAEDFAQVADEIKMVTLNRNPEFHSYHNPRQTLIPGGQLLARLGIKEGPQWTLEVLRSKDGKGSFKNDAVATVLRSYGANAKEAVEWIQQDEKILRGVSSGRRQTKNWNALLKAIESGKDARDMIPFEEARQGKVAK
jgi:hypothetical protein